MTRTPDAMFTGRPTLVPGARFRSDRMDRKIVSEDPMMTNLIQRYGRLREAGGEQASPITQFRERRELAGSRSNAGPAAQLLASMARIVRRPPTPRKGLVINACRIRGRISLLRELSVLTVNILSFGSRLKTASPRKKRVNVSPSAEEFSRSPARATQASNPPNRRPNRNSN
jgi:hypothetical protein